MSIQHVHVPAPPRHIVVTTDASDRAGLAVQRASQLATEHGSQLSAIHVLPPGLDERLVACARSSVDSHLARFADSVPLEVTIRQGAVIDEIARSLARTGADLVCIGAHGEHGLADPFLGSTPERLLQVVDLPVLVVRKRVQTPYRTVVLAVDSSPPATAAAHYANALTPTARHTVVNISIVVGENLMRMYGVDEADLASLRRNSTEDAHAVMNQLSASLAPAPERVVIESGHPATRLVEHCRLHATDLVALGTGGRSRVSYSLLGSVAQRVLRQSSSDVLVVHVAKD